MITTERKNNLSISVQIREHSLISDVGSESGGQDEGPNPHEILEAALGACTSMTVQMYANRKGWDLKSCNAKIQFIQDDKDAIVISREISFAGNLDETQKERLFQIAEKCPIHNVISRGAKIDSLRVKE